MKLSSVLRPRAPPGTGTGTGTPFQLETAVKNIKLPVPGLQRAENFLYHVSYHHIYLGADSSEFLMIMFQRQVNEVNETDFR